MKDRKWVVEVLKMEMLDNMEKKRRFYKRKKRRNAER